MSDKLNYKVGQVCYLLPIGNNARRFGKEQELKKSKIVKVGRLYFYVLPDEYRDDESLSIKFSIETKRHVNGGYSANWEIYEKEQDYYDYKERLQLNRKISDAFQYGRSDVDDLGALRAIADLIDKHTKG